METKTVNVTDVIESGSFVGLPLRICILVFIIMLIDGFDLASVGFVGPAVLADWGLVREDLGPVFAASMIGMAVGSIILGWLGDKIGRKSSYIVCIAFLFIGSALSAIASGPTDLLIYRFITGIGLGGVTPLAATLITEWTSKRARPGRSLHRRGGAGRRLGRR